MRPLFRNAVYLVSSLVISKGLMFVFIVFLARSMGSAGFGAFGYAFSLTQFFFQLVDFGLNMLMIREIAIDRSKTNALFTQSVILRALLGAFATAVAIGITAAFGKPPDVLAAVILFSIGVTANALVLSYCAVFRAYGRMGYEAAINILLVVTYAGIAAAGVLPGWGVVWIAGAYAASGGIGLAVCAILGIHRLFVPSWHISVERLASLARHAWPFGVGLLCTLGMSRIGVVLVSALIGDREAGWFQGIYSIVTSLNMALGMTIAAVFPKLAVASTEGGDRLAVLSEKVLRVLCIGVFPLVCGMSVYGRQIVVGIFGHDYREGWSVFSIMIWSTLPFLVANVFGNILIIARRERLYALGALVLLVCNVMVYYTALQKFGLRGGAIAAVLADALMAVLFVALARGYRGREVGAWVRWLGAAAIFAACATVLVRYMGAVALALGSVAYVGLVIWTGAVQRDEVALLRGMIPRQAAGVEGAR